MDAICLWTQLRARVEQESAERLAEIWSGDVILLTRRWGGPGADPTTFNLRWFLLSLWRYRKPLAHVLIASLFIQLFALVTPLFFQMVIDKVLPHRATSTLLVVVIGLLAIGLFDVTLQYLRSYALNHTTSRIDVELGARLFDQLIRLPLSYFETRPVGQTVARVRELETIRTFLTGRDSHRASTSYLPWFLSLSSSFTHPYLPGSLSRQYQFTSSSRV